MKTIFMFAVAVTTLSGIMSTCEASIISDCTSSRYCYMGGSIASATKDYMLVGDRNADYWGYAWLTFETPSETVSSAYLNLQSIAQSAGMWSVPESNPVTITVYTINDDVTKIGNSYSASSFKDMIGEAIASEIVSGGDDIYSWDITALVNEWVTGGSNYGLLLSISSLTNGLTYAKFAGVGHSSGIDPVITDIAMAVPEPTTLVLLGLGTLFSCRKRRTH